MGSASEGEHSKGINQTLQLRAGSRDESEMTRDSDAINWRDFQNTQFQFLRDRPA